MARCKGLDLGFAEICLILIYYENKTLRSLKNTVEVVLSEQDISVLDVN